MNPLTLPAAAGLISPDGHTALVPVDQIVNTDADRPVAAGALGSYVHKLTLAPGARAEVTGEWPVWSDFNKINAEALHKAELVSGLPTLILLFVAFGMLIAAGIPLVLALAGIAVGFALLHVIGWFIPMSVWSMNFSMMIGLAVGIDYSLFIVSRYREERVEGKDALAAIENTMSTAGKAVFLSALDRRHGARRGVPRPGHGVPVDGPRHDPVGRRRRARVAHAPARVARRARRPCARPQEPRRSRHHRGVPLATDDRRRAATPGRGTGDRARRASARSSSLRSACISACPAPRSSTRATPAATATTCSSTAFGPGAAAPAFITTPGVATRRPSSGSPPPCPAWSTPASSRQPAATGRVVVRVTGSTAVDDSRTATLVNTLARPTRDCGARSTRVGGPAAQNRDLTAVLTGRAPYAIGLILIVAFLLLLVVFRSLVVALTSILMNLLTVGAAFGFATLVFQHGFGTGLLGIEHQPFVDAWAPLFFFALLVRALDGLPTLLARRDPRALRSHRRHETSDR